MKNLSDRRSSLALNVFVALLCLVMIAPIAVVVILSFGGDNFMRFPPSSMSLRWYERFIGDGAWLSAFWRSFVIAGMSSVLATVIGFLCAYSLVRSDSRLKKLVLSLMLLPMIVPTIILSISLYYISAPFGFVGSKLWISVCHAVISLPIVILIMISSLQSVDVNLERAAFGMGASRSYAIRTLVIPIAFPGLMSAVLFSFLQSFDELVISLFLGGVSGETLPVRIWNSLRNNVDSTVAAVSSCLILVTVLVLLLELTVRMSRRRVSGSGN